jgi:hypothetical protein
MKLQQTEGSETSAYKIQTPRNQPKVRIKHSVHDEGLKSRIKYNLAFRAAGDAMGKGTFASILNLKYFIQAVKFR